MNQSDFETPKELPCDVGWCTAVVVDPAEIARRFQSGRPLCVVHKVDRKLHPRMLTKTEIEEEARKALPSWQRV